MTPLIQHLANLLPPPIRHPLLAFRNRIGPLWWHTGLMFAVSRLADVIQLYIGMFLVPAVVSEQDLGAVLPLTRLTGLVAVPLSVVSGTALKYVSLFLVRGEHGKIKALLRDLSWLLTGVAALLVLVLWLGWDAIARRMEVSDRRLMWIMGATILLSCWGPLTTTVAQGLKHFYRMTLSRLAGPLARLAVILLCLKSLQLVGYFAANLASGLAVVVLLAGGTVSYLRRRTPAQSYRGSLPEMVRYGIPVGITAALIALQQTVEPWVIRHRLPAVDSAGYYVAAMFGNIPLWVAPAMVPFLFPLVAERFERGESTHRLHLQSVVVTLLIGIAITLFLSLFGARILALRPAWTQYAAYAPFMWKIALITTADVLIGCHITHETACRRFGYLRVLGPVILLGTTMLYALPHVFSRSRTLLFFVGFMMAMRLSLLVCSGVVWIVHKHSRARFQACATALILGVLVVACGCGRPSVDAPATPISLASLVGRMTNLTAFAERPLGQSYLVSSYDRSGGNMDWAVWTKADADGRITLLDVDGPGYVSRIWVASISAKRWLFFIDGETDARLVLTTEELFGGRFPFAPPLAGNSGGGRYSLMPVPFAKHIKIAVEPVNLKPDNRNYFQINYTRLWPESSGCSSWPADISAAESNAVIATLNELELDHQRIAHLAAILAHEGTLYTAQGGGSITPLDVRGQGVVEALAVQIVTPTGADLLDQQALRNLRMRMYWDGSAAPSVDVPLGDFFCNPFYTRTFSSLVLGRTNDTYVCRLPMPYRDGARWSIENHGTGKARIRAWAGVSTVRSAANLRRFHATWNASTTTGVPFEMASCRGPGHYIGCLLTAVGQDGSWNILEGDEHVLPDPGDQVPQMGTGLEDYFSGAYYYSGLFDLPYHGLIEKGAMRTDQYRFLALDAVDFRRELRCEIEFGDQNRAQGYMSSVVYWYADAANDSTIPADRISLLPPPKDRFELEGLMAQMFTLERASLGADAADRCDFLARRYGQYPWSDLFHLRAAAYREGTLGFSAVRDAYAALARSRYEPAARQAADLEWLHQGAQNALLGIDIRGTYSLSINGKPVARGVKASTLDVRRINIQPGPHNWEVDFLPTERGSYVSLSLRTASGLITSAGDWTVVETEPFPGRDPPKAIQGRSALPNMTLWQFEPNGYVGMQSGAQCLSVWHFWDSAPTVKRIRIRQSWTNEAGLGVQPPVPLHVPERSAEEERAHAVN